MDNLVCPFCSRLAFNEYHLRLHIEKRHTADSPFVISKTSQSPTRSTENDPKRPIGAKNFQDYFQCPHHSCGELVLQDDLDEHVAIHLATEGSLSNPIQQSPKRGLISRDQTQHHTVVADTSKADSPSPPRRLTKDRNLFGLRIGSIRRPNDNEKASRIEHDNQSSSKTRSPGQPGQLGRRELGPHAYERVMPLHVRRQLTEDALPHFAYHITSLGKLDRVVTVPNETDGLVRILGDLCALDTRIERTYLCHPNVKHIVRIRCDGNFCGYWNIQMFVSHLQSIGALPDLQGLPNVLEIQDGIENAWDKGIGAYGRVETGGIRGTRKWIGSQEAFAYLKQVGADVDALAFREQHSDATVESLLDYVEAYFLGGENGAKVHRNTHTTKLAPIYFQRRGHSTTIVGLERKKNGRRNLLVFDPSFPTSEPVRKLLNGKRTVSRPEALLEPYRRSDLSLTRSSEFELVL